MNNALKQQEEELAIFENFMRVCKYPIIKESVLQQVPPKTDIFCKLSTGVSIEFELTNSIDYQLAQNMNDDKILYKGGFVNAEPIQQNIIQKNEKLKAGKYQLHADRVELLVYLGLMPSYPHWGKAIPNFLEENKSLWGFGRIWIFRDDIVDPKILWSYSTED